MATRHDTGPQGEGVPMPPVFEAGAEGEEIFDPEDAEEEAFDLVNDTVTPEPEPVGSNSKENHAAAVDHIERAVRKLGYVFSCSVVLRLAMDGQNADQDSRDVRGQVQSHGLGGVQNRHYDRHEYLAEKRATLGLLKVHLAALRTQTPAAAVPVRAAVPMPAAGDSGARESPAAATGPDWSILPTLNLTP